MRSAAAPFAAAAMPPIADPPVSRPSWAAVDAAAPIEVPARIAPMPAPATPRVAATAAPPATANVAPAAMSALCKACLAGDAKRAAGINRPLEALHRDLFVEANPIPVKWALAQMGMIGAGIRLPLTWLSEPFHPTLRAALQQAGLV